jgi:hypothetical protein
LSINSPLTGSPPSLSHQDADRAPIYPRPCALPQSSALPSHLCPASQHGAALRLSAPPSSSCLAASCAALLGKSRVEKGLLREVSAIRWLAGILGERQRRGGTAVE